MIDKIYDLEQRTLKFSKNIRFFIKNVRVSTANIENCKQLAISSGSVGANYIETNESVSLKDCIFRIKICKKEIKESRYWLELIDTRGDNILEEQRQKLIQETNELMKIFASIIQKLENNNKPI